MGSREGGERHSPSASLGQVGGQPGWQGASLSWWLTL